MTLDFAPLLHFYALVALAVGAVLVAVGLFVQGARGRILRGGALAALLMALVNPVLYQEEREPLQSVVSVVVDRSQSQNSL